MGVASWDAAAEPPVRTKQFIELSRYTLVDWVNHIAKTKHDNYNSQIDDPDL